MSKENEKDIDLTKEEEKQVDKLVDSAGKTYAEAIEIVTGQKV